MKKLILLLLITSLFAAPAFAGKVSVSIAGDDEEIQSYKKSRVTYISFSELVEILGGLIDWAEVGHKVSYKIDTSNFHFLLESAYFKLGDSIFNMTYPAELREGQLYLPVKTFIPFLDRVISDKVTWDKNKKLIRISSDYFNVADLTVLKKANGLLIEVFLTVS